MLSPKLRPEFALMHPTSVPNFNRTRVRACELEPILWFVWNDEEQNEEQKLNFWFLVSWCDLFQFWNPASPYRRAVPQQIWWPSGKRSWIYECVKITTLFFLLICDWIWKKPSFHIHNIKLTISPKIDYWLNRLSYSTVCLAPKSPVCFLWQLFLGPV